MSKEIQYTQVRNVTKRNFNGVRPYQIVSVADENLFMYLNAWFEKYDPDAQTEDIDLGIDKKTVAPEEVSEDELKARKDFLNKQGVNTPNWGEKRLLSESTRLGFTDEAQTEVNADEVANVDNVDATIQGLETDTDADTEEEQVL